MPDAANRAAAHALGLPAHPAQRVALTVSAIFVLVGFGWVVATDLVLYQVVNDRAVIARFETAKGWLFIGMTAILLYLVTLRTTSQLGRVGRLTVAIIESIADGVLLLGRDRRIAHANQAAARMLRCPRVELVGVGAAEFSRRFRVSYPDGSVVPPEEFASQRAFDEVVPLKYKAMLYPPGDDELVFAATAAPVATDAGHRPEWVVSVMHDITEPERAERIRDHFFAAAAHSLKTPVAVIKGNVHAVLPHLPPAISASLDRQCDRVDRLVQNMLVLARSRSRSLELHPTELDLGSLVREIAREPSWAARRDVRADVSGPCRVRADAERLALVLRNCMYEAYRLSPQDSTLTLQVACERGAAAGDRLEIAIRYQPVSWRDQASELYEEHDDLGIARSAARTIVTAHGGDVTEQTNQAEVAIRIHLPLPPEPSDESPR